ncbi:thioesterase domain-containing protein [Shewanella sp. UCD-KL12]|uniref:thioesterase domain-containing protein n=1 Tax=Shewanella sp. UCD-KL12 TaxID=1917163 RepID=UPI0009709EE6|nr:thioesterase domain-containing protein [Shewanella sp. UCD-KL12]
MALSEQQLLAQLKQTWHQTIPLSQFMAVEPLSVSGNKFKVTAPLAPNINLHQTMFAGSIYTLMTLTGWGMVWLLQQRAQVQGDIVLAGAHIRYLAPVTEQPIAVVSCADIELAPLGRGKRVKIPLTVELFCAEKLCAQFEAKYVSLPIV